jgi:hypothetical protein|tara:strand:- start:1268 stop:1963 length:696 start_codon:yes stop_codon:yes gene_type:complete
MLALKLGLSLNTIKPIGSWTPESESSALAWWKKATGVTTEEGKLTDWLDQIGNNHNFRQATEEERPTYTSSGANEGTVTFDSSATNNLEITTQITFAANSAFTVGMRVNVGSTGSLFTDNTTSGEFIRIMSTTQLRIKLSNGTSRNFDLSEGVWTDKKTIIVTRTTGGLITVLADGVAVGTQTDTAQLLIDNFGVRRTDLNPYDGSLLDASIFTDTNATLTTNLQNYLKDL